MRRLDVVVDLGTGDGAVSEGAPRRARELSLTEFAVWSRRNHVRLPHPIDISQVDRDGVSPPHDVRELELLAEVAREPRVSAFAMRSRPDGSTDVHVALASSSRAVMINMVGERVRVRAVAEDQLAARVVGALPDLDPLAVRPATVTESEWDRFTLLAASAAAADSSAAVDSFVTKLGDDGLPPDLARAMLRAARDPVPVGVLAAESWTGAKPVVGPRYVAWFEYETGALAAERPPPRGSGPSVLHLGPYSRQNAFYQLAAAIRDALGPMAVVR